MNKEKKLVITSTFFMCLALFLALSIVIKFGVMKAYPEEKTKEFVCEQDCLITFDNDNATESLFINNQHRLLGSYPEENLNKNQKIMCCLEVKK
jgi:hypothetical protein